MGRKTSSIFLGGHERSSKLASMLVDESCWFTCDPWPNDIWLFIVKSEKRKRIEEIVASLPKIGEPINTVDGYEYWDSHPDFPVSDWRHEVADNNTRMGYWDWVRSEMESKESEVNND